jgi:hypothetical protein
MNTFAQQRQRPALQHPHGPFVLARTDADAMVASG